MRLSGNGSLIQCYITLSGTLSDKQQNNLKELYELHKKKIGDNKVASTKKAAAAKKYFSTQNPSGK